MRNLLFISWLVGCLLIVCTIANNASASPEEDKENQPPLVAVNEDVKAPKLDVMVENDHIEATYYEPDITGEEYTQDRRDFDLRLFTAIEKMSEDVLIDIIEKHKNFLQLGGHAGVAKNLLGTYLPEYSRLVDDGKHGRPAKNEFLADTLAIWWKIQDAASVEASKPLPNYEVRDQNGNIDKAKTKAAQEEAKKETEVAFIANFRKLMRNLKYTIANSPVGLYLDWKTININGKSIVEVGTPFLTHLKRYNGMSIKILNLIVNLIGHVKL